MEQTMFDTLLSLPLFQGLGHDDLTRIIESTHLEFQSMLPGTQLVRQDDLCNELTFVMQGTVAATARSADHAWSVTEQLPSPMVLGLESLYGSSRVFHSSYEALSEVRILRVDKRTIAALTRYFEVFRINVLNALSALTAHQRLPLWLPAPATLSGRIVQFMRQHVARPAGRKTFQISMQQLGTYLGEDKRYISKALHELQQRQLIHLERRRIEVPAFENVIKEKL